MIEKFPPSKSGQDAAHATPGPKNIYFDGVQFVVKTGADYEAQPAPTQDELDRREAMAYAKLNELKTMTPAQIQNRAKTNLNTLTEIRDAITTLEIAVSILARNL